MIGKRIKEWRKSKGLTQQTLADALSTSSGHISDIENGKTKPGADFLLSLLREFDINLNWLLTGEGPIYIKDKGPAVREPPDEDPEIAEILRMTREVVKSDTEYAHSLVANVKSFYSAVQTARHLQTLDERVNKLEQQRDRDSGGEPIRKQAG